jgi:hypothetical protein
MAQERAVIDISDRPEYRPELARLVKEVAQDGRPHVLRADGADLAVLSPVRPARHRARHADRLPPDDHDELLAELARRRRQGLSWTDATAGILKRYAKTPPPTPREEKDAFEEAVVEGAMERRGD